MTTVTTVMMMVMGVSNLPDGHGDGSGGDDDDDDDDGV